jgi:hypothetical protein
MIWNIAHMKFGRVKNERTNNPKRLSLARWMNMVVEALAVGEILNSESPRHGPRR